MTELSTNGPKQLKSKLMTSIETEYLKGLDGT